MMKPEEVKQLKDGSTRRKRFATSRSKMEMEDRRGEDAEHDDAEVDQPFKMSKRVNDWIRLTIECELAQLERVQCPSRGSSNSACSSAKASPTTRWRAATPSSSRRSRRRPIGKRHAGHRLASIVPRKGSDIAGVVCPSSSQKRSRRSTSSSPVRSSAASSNFILSRRCPPRSGKV